MAIRGTIKEVEFGVGDTVRVWQKVKEGEKIRLQPFEGFVIKIRGEGDGKSFTVRRIGANHIGIEKIFPFSTPILEKIEVLKRGREGVRKAKLYYLRNKPKKAYDDILKRASAKKTS